MARLQGGGVGREGTAEGEIVSTLMMLVLDEKAMV